MERGFVDEVKGRAVISALVTGTLGAAVLCMLPAFLGALGRAYHLTNLQLGILSSVELSGVTVGSAVASRFVKRIHRIVYVGLACAAASNGACVFAHDFGPMLSLRAVAGLGSGALIAACYATLGRSRHVERNFALYLLGQSLFSALSIPLISMLSGRLQVRASFLILAVLLLASTPLVRSLPSAAKQSLSGDRGGHAGARAWIGLSGIFAFFISEGATWAYLQIIAVKGGVDSKSAGTAIAAAALIGLAGSAVAAILGDRITRSVPIILALALAIVASLVLHSPLSLIRFTAAACLLTIAWSFSIPYQLSAVAAVDMTGYVVGAAASVSLAGLAAGPLAAALVVGWGGSTGVVALSAAFFLLSVVSLVPALTYRASPVPARRT